MQNHSLWTNRFRIISVKFALLEGCTLIKVVWMMEGVQNLSQIFRWVEICWLQRSQHVIHMLSLSSKPFALNPLRRGRSHQGRNVSSQRKCNHSCRDPQSMTEPLGPFSCQSQGFGFFLVTYLISPDFPVDPRFLSGASGISVFVLLLPTSPAWAHRPFSHAKKSTLKTYSVVIHSTTCFMYLWEVLCNRRTGYRTLFRDGDTSAPVIYQASCLSVPLPSLLQWSRHYHTLNASHHTLHFLWHAIHLSNGPVGCGRPVITYARCFCVSVCICTVMYLSLDLCHLKFCADESVFVLAVSSSLNHPPVHTHFCTLFIVCLCHL